MIIHLSWRSDESSLKSGESSEIITSFSTTSAKAGMCANAALQGWGSGV